MPGLKMSEVTVAIPTRNRPELLKETLESVFCQSYMNPTIFVSDNSTDDSSEPVVKTLQASHPNLFYKRHDPPIGHRNWSYVISQCTTQYVAFLHDDDILLPHHLASGVAALSENPTASFYACAAGLFNETGPAGVMMPNVVANSTALVTVPRKSRYDFWLAGCTIIPSSVILRRDAFDQINIRGEGLTAADWLWWGQLALAGDYIADPNIGVLYRIHSVSGSSTTPRALWSAHQRYTRRVLAASALRQNALSLDALERVVVAEWAPATIAQLILAFSTPDTPKQLRKSMRRILKQRPDVFAPPSVSRHVSVARYAGAWYLSYADLVDRILARWWPPSIQ